MDEWHHSFVLYEYTVKYRYNAVQCIMISYRDLRKQWQKVNRITSQQTPHISPSRASNRVSNVKVSVKTDAL